MPASPEHNHHHAGDGAVVIDIGDDVGALVLHTTADLVGAEIDITPVSDQTRRSHVAVHPRPVPGGPPRYAAVYPALVEGDYQLWRPDGTPTAPVTISGGVITEADWGVISA